MHFYSRTVYFKQPGSRSAFLLQNSSSVFAIAALSYTCAICFLCNRLASEVVFEQVTLFIRSICAVGLAKSTLFNALSVNWAEGEPPTESRGT